MSTPKQRSIGLAVDTVGSYGREVLHGVMSFCHRNPNWVIEVEPRFWVYDDVPHPEEWHVDGVIVQAYNKELVDRVRGLKTPAVNVANMFRGPTEIPTIVPDDLAIGTMAAEYFASLGLRSLAYCTDGQNEYAALRGRAFHGFASKSGFMYFECDASVHNIRNWLPTLPHPTGIFCSNDAMAHRVLSAAQRLKIAVPDQVAVLGVDDDELLNMVGSCPLSSIAIPASKIGYEAARLLDAALNGTPAPMMTTLPPSCVVPRATTDISCVNDVDVAKAMQFIKSNVTRPIQVNDVLDHVAMSRRTLERRFRTLVGRSVAQEIRRAHIERAKQLLTVTNLSIQEVAAASGFVNPTLLGVIFRKQMGESPSMFRERSVSR